MGLNRIVMRLARNPGTEFADGDDHRGYALVAPLTPDGKLVRVGQRWYFDYDNAEDTGEEPGFRLGQHRFAVGEYVSITDEDGRLLTYKVTEVAAV